MKIVLQLEEKDCGVACLLSLIQYYGGDDNFENLRRLSGTAISGTTLLGLYQAAQAVGFDAEGCEATMDSLLEHPSPCILHVHFDNNVQHYFVYFGKENHSDQLLIGDPARGMVLMSKEELDKLWRTKACLVLQPTEQFRKVKDVRTKKIKWIKELVKQDRLLLVIAALMGIVIGALGLTLAIFMQRLIDDFIPHKNYDKLYTGIFLVLIFLISKELISLLRTNLLLRQSKDFNVRIGRDFFSRLLYLPKPFFDSRRIGDLTARLHDTVRIQRVISQIAGNTLLDIMVVIVTLSFVFSYSAIAGLIALVALPVLFLLLYNKNKQIQEAQKMVMVGYALSESNYISTLQGIETIKNFNREALFIEANNYVNVNFQTSVFNLGKIQIRLSFLANTFAAFLLTGLLSYLCSQVFSGHFKAGELLAVMGMVGSLLPSVANLALLSIPINEAGIAFNRMHELTQLPNTSIGSDQLSVISTIQVAGLSFRYAGRRPILKSISFKVKKGEVIAIMGENGCGKSTISQLLLKHYVPENGTIIVNEKINIESLNSANWRTLIGVVPQQVYIFNGTVLDNISVGRSDVSIRQVIDFLNAYGFDAFISSLPHGLHTIIGEDGINLSGGQQQLIAFARALYSMPQLLILDEATSAMDRENEQFIMRTLQKIKKDTAIILITHKPQLLKAIADNILVVENGIVAAQGTHKSLLQYDNLYRRYWSDIVD